MPRIHSADADDPAFLQLVSNLVESLTQREGFERLHLIHVDNWFDHKWLRFGGLPMQHVAEWKRGERLTPPAFHPNRILSQQDFERDDTAAAWREIAPKTEVHPHIESGTNLQRRVSGVAPDAALVWYTGNTRPNRRGALMAYVPSEGGYHTWYAGLVAGPEWKVDRAREISHEDLWELVQGRAVG